MAPLTAWLPTGREQPSDLVVRILGSAMERFEPGLAAFDCALSAEGFEVMTQWTCANGTSNSLPSVKLRISTERLNSMGSGCDVLAYLDEEVPQPRPVNLAPGSVLLGERCAIPKLLPDGGFSGVIAYPIPFVELSNRLGKIGIGKGLIALGVLTQLLGFPEQKVRNHLRPGLPQRYFNAGITYAADHVQKHDVFALRPPVTASTHIVLDAQRSFLLGIGAAQCACETACLSSLHRTPGRWVADHVARARQSVTELRNPRIAGMTLFQGPQGNVKALLGTTDISSVGEGPLCRHGVVCVAADLLDLMCLAKEVHQLGSELHEPVWILADETLATRRHSISLQLFEHAARHGSSNGNQLRSTSLRAVHEGEPDAEVGFVAWGSAQGVVREALELCRNFGMRLAALYPKMVKPVPVEDLKAFAASVSQLVVVEPTCTAYFTNLVRNSTSLAPFTIHPEQGMALTPMDIFMRENLGIRLIPPAV